jgi:hypothetical protein
MRHGVILSGHVILSEAKNLLLVLVMALVIPSAATALQTQTPRPAPKTAKELVARHMAVAGGEANLRAQKPFHVVMTVPFGQGMEARTEMYMHPPERIYTRTMMPGGIGDVQAGFDGTTGWTLSDMTGPMILPMEQARQLAKNARMNSDPQADASLTLRGETKIDGRRVWIVDGVMPDSAKVTQYFDDESGLLVGIDAGDYTGPKKPMMSLRDYKRFGAVLMATTMVMRMATGDSVVTRVLEFEQKAIPDSIFALPAAVKALLPKPPGGKPR